MLILSRNRCSRILMKCRGVARIFQRGGGGGHTVSNIIVVAFSPRNVVGCLLKKRLTKGGGGSRAHQDPLATPLKCSFSLPQSWTEEENIFAETSFAS